MHWQECNTHLTIYLIYKKTINDLFLYYIPVKKIKFGNV
jgi:hypothetical protein